MSLSKGQLVSILLFIAVFLLIYFGFDTKTKDQRSLEKLRDDNIELLNIQKFISDSKQDLTSEMRTQIAFLESSLNEHSREDTVSILKDLKSLASLWYAGQNELASAYYAEKIALMSNNSEAWAMAGTSYAISAKKNNLDRLKQYSLDKSRESLEKSISLNPSNIESKINLALSFVDAPLQDNPMKGILMLVDLNKKHPDNIAVLTQLGRLSIQTNQLDKAEERFTRVLQLDSNNRNAHCYLYQVYKAKSNNEKAEYHNQLCNK